MADKPIKGNDSKKLKIKTHKKGIGEKIARQQQRDQLEHVAPVKEVSKPVEEVAAKTSTETPVVPPVVAEKPAQPAEKKPAPPVRKAQSQKSIFVESPAPAPAPAAGATAASKEKKGAAKARSNLREDILKEEEHKKFFLRQQNRGKGRKDSSEGMKSTSSIPREVKITEYIQVGELARKLNIKTSDVISKLMHMGVMATITQSIDADTAILVAGEYGCEVKVVSLYEETLIQDESDRSEQMVSRPPVVTIMGHVDHGKTKLLDSLRQTDIASTEAGGITQHIGAYQVQTHKGRITFLDTPGHEAFTAMRARGAQITDIVVLVVAADDGVMPQTIEAISHAKDANVPIIVAINKIDSHAANPERIRQQLMQYELVPEDWGGHTPYVEVSALKKINLDKLEDVILATAEVMELKADPTKKAVGTVVEAKLDPGRGPVATVLVAAGTLRQGDPIVVGLEGGRIRAMVNDKGVKVASAEPAMPVEILGLSGVPNAGDPFHVMSSEKEAREIVEKRQELHRQQQAQQIKKVKLENLNQIIEDGKILELKIIIKADVRGSVEALQASLEKLNIAEVRVNIIFGGTGEITESDVMLASAANALIIGFNTRANTRVKEIAAREGVEIKYYNIIYQAIDDVKAALTGMLSPDISEEVTGEMEIRESFKISGIGVVGGCMVISGFIRRNSAIRLIREGVVIYTGKLKSLKRFQDDVAEVKEGYECGILIDGYNDIKTGDIVEAFVQKEVSRTVNDVYSDSGN